MRLTIATIFATCLTIAGCGGHAEEGSLDLPSRTGEAQPTAESQPKKSPASKRGKSESGIDLGGK